jgi:hypothetical protein
MSSVPVRQSGPTPRVAFAGPQVLPSRGGSAHRARWLLPLLPLATILCLALGLHAWLKLVYPAMAIVLGLALFRWHPSGYLAFSLWLWFLSPLVRRLVDYRVGWDETSTILVTPLLVTGICCASFIRHLPKLRQKPLIPFGIVAATLLYGWLLGLLEYGLASTTYTFLLYAVPLCFGFHIAVHWRRYDTYRATLIRVMTVAVGVMGLYGIWQFFSPQPWDAYWMENADMSSIGYPQPMMVRVFSTLNSPQPYGMVTMCGLLILLSGRPTLHWLAGVPGYLGLLLSLVRTAWLGWMVAFAVYLAYASTRSRVRVIAVILPLATLVLVLSATPALERVVDRRFETFTSLSEDLSLLHRVQLYSNFISSMQGDAGASGVEFHPLGNGLGGTGGGARLSEEWARVDFDSGIIDIIQAFGLAGGLAFYTAIFMLFQQLMRPIPGRDRFTAIARGIPTAIFAAMLAQNTVTGVSAVFFWGLAGFCLAAASLSQARR